MNLLDNEELHRFLKGNFPSVHRGPEQINFASEYDGVCDACGKDVFLKTKGYYFMGGQYGRTVVTHPTFLVVLCRCPRCQRLAFEFYIETHRNLVEPVRPGVTENVSEFEAFKVFSLPTEERSYILQDIPGKYPQLSQTVGEAMFCMHHGQLIAATIMFRRAIQIIAKDILGAEGNSLAKQLDWLRDHNNSLSVNLTDLFHENADLIRKVGNQGAHPDVDEDLQTFEKEDVHALHDLLLAIIGEIFIRPQKEAELKKSLKANRKLL